MFKFYYEVNIFNTNNILNMCHFEIKIIFYSKCDRLDESGISRIQFSILLHLRLTNCRCIGFY